MDVLTDHDPSWTGQKHRQITVQRSSNEIYLERTASNDQREFLLIVLCLCVCVCAMDTRESWHFRIIIRKYVSISASTFT